MLDFNSKLITDYTCIGATPAPITHTLKSIAHIVTHRHWSRSTPLVNHNSISPMRYNHNKKNKSNKSNFYHSPNYTQTHIVTYYKQPDSANPNHNKQPTHTETQPHNTHLYSTLQLKINKHAHSPISNYNH